MQTPPFFIICVVVTLATIEAVPWFKQNPKKRQGQLIESKNNDAADFAVDDIGVNGGDFEMKNGGGLTRWNQNADENPDEGEGDDDHGGNGGGNGNQFGGGFQGGRGIQRGTGPQGGLESNSRESFGGRGSLGCFGYPGSRRNKGGRPNHDNGDDRREENSEGDNDSLEFTWKPKHSCRGCRLSNIGNGISNSNKVFIHEK